MNAKKITAIVLSCVLSLVSIYLAQNVQNFDLGTQMHSLNQSFVILKKYSHDFVDSFANLVSNNASLDRPLCTLAFLKQHAQRRKKYTTMPFTQIGKRTTVAPPGQYDCWFDDSPANASSQAARCDTDSGSVRSILQFGDSNGRRYADAFVDHLRARSWKCSILKQEQPAKPSMPDPKYFVRPPLITLSDIRVSSRSCHGCVSFLTHCSRANRTLTFEYLALQFFDDTEITTTRNRNVTYYYADGNQTSSYQVQSSASQQHFIFDEYLAGRYPDVIVFFISSHFRHKTNDVERVAASFFDIVERRVPQSTRVIIASSMKRQYVIGNANPSLGKLLFENKFTANDMQLWLNARVYDAALSRLADSVKRWYAFPSLYDVSNATDRMYRDHVHRTPAWYTSVTRYILQLICMQ